MAIINSIILGKAKGSIGNVSLSTIKGRVIARQKPTIVANPRTKLQRHQRSKMATAVVSWKMVGNLLKSGITQLTGYGSAFNTYVAKNIDLFQNQDLTVTTFRNRDLVGTFATLGTIQKITANVTSNDDDSVTVGVNLAELKNIANDGDALKIVVGDVTQAEVSYAEFKLTNSYLNGSSSSVTFEDLDLSGASNIVYAVWFESADGKVSSTSTFVQK